MARPTCMVLTAVFALAGCADSLQAAELVGQSLRGPGAYFSWWKLLTLALLFLVWVKLTDWMNTDGMKIGTDIKQPPEIWNLICIGSFIVGFWLAVSIPIFWAGLPLYVVAVFGPFIVYFIRRRGKFKANPRLRQKLIANTGEVVMDALPQDEGAPVEFKAAGAGPERQANLIRARQTGFQSLKDLVHQAVERRAEVIMLDYTRDTVAGQMMIDGTWHPLPPMDRVTGDAVLASLKHLAGLNAQDRRTRQQGSFEATAADQKLGMELLTQGTKTGERAQLKLLPKKKAQLSLVQLGMWPDMVRRLSLMLDQPGLVIVAAPPRGGLTSSWRASLAAADRITRDWIGVMDEHDESTAIENIVPHTYSAASGQTPADLLPRLLLSQPDAVAIPQLTDSRSLDIACEQVIKEQRTVLTQIQANSAAEALHKFYSLAGDKRLFCQAVTAVTCQRLARRLCDTCKTPVVVQPQVIRQMGGDPSQQNTLFNHYVLPPVEQRVDEQGKPIEMQPCGTCSGIGFIGRIGVFEMIAVNDQIRTAMLKQPGVESIQKVALQTGNESMLAGGYKLALLGITSVSEVQRVFKV